jgi:hypothetical protein
VISVCYAKNPASRQVCQITKLGQKAKYSLAKSPSLDLFIPKDNIHGVYLVAPLAPDAVMIVDLHKHAISPSRIPASASASSLTLIKREGYEPF